jgi:hypothetical protein
MTFDRWIIIVGIFGVIINFVWDKYEYFQNERRQIENRRIEATKPFLERQLKLYTDVSVAAATLATSNDEGEWDAAVKRFWSLYWGELALVEDTRVEEAMVELGKGINQNVEREKLQWLSLNLARACRDSLAVSWGAKEWQYPAP